MNREEVNTYHLDSCTGHYKKKVLDPFYFVDNTPPLIEKEVKCEEVTIGYTYNYIPHFIVLGQCFFYNKYGKRSSIKEYQIVEHSIEENHNDTVFKFRYDQVPEWNGTPWIYETIQIVDMWVYCVQTPLSKLENIFKDWDDKDRLDAERYGQIYIVYEYNIKYLKKQEIVSKVCNRYEVKQADINYLHKKLSKQLNK